MPGKLWVWKHLSQVSPDSLAPGGSKHMWCVTSFLVYWAQVDTSYFIKEEQLSDPYCGTWNAGTWDRTMDETQEKTNDNNETQEGSDNGTKVFSLERLYPWSQVEVSKVPKVWNLKKEKKHFVSWKEFWSETILGPKKFWVWKFFCVLNIFGQKIIWVGRSFIEEHFRPQKLWVQKVW